MKGIKNKPVSTPTRNVESGSTDAPRLAIKLKGVTEEERQKYRIPSYKYILP